MNKLIKKAVAFGLGSAMTLCIVFSISSISRNVEPAIAVGTDNTKYSLITSEADLEPGKSYIITNFSSNSGYAMGNSESTNNRNAVSVSCEADKTIVRTSSIMSIVLGGSADNWTLNAENYLGSGTGLTQGNQTSKNYLKISTDSDKWTISFSSRAAVIKSNLKTTRNIIRFNNSNNPKIFSCYSSGMDAVYLWKEVVEKEISSISASLTDSSKTWYVGDTVTATDFTVVPTYSDGTSGDPITDGTGVTITNGNLTLAGANEVTVKYQGISTTVSVTAQAARTMTGIELHGTLSKTNYSIGDTWDLTGLDIQVNWSTGEPTYVSLNDENVACECTPETANSLTLTSFDIRVLYEEFDETFTVSGVTVSSITSDTLTVSDTTATGTTYTEWSDVMKNSSAVYAGKSAKNSNGSIQLTNKSTTLSGIVSTSSGGLISKITVEWDSSTTSGRILNIYGKTTAYSGPGDLDSTKTQGTLLGTIVYGTSTEFAVSGSYTYVGIRPDDGAVYLSSVTFDWAQEIQATSELISVEITGTPTKLSYYVGDVMDYSGIDVIAHYSDSSEDKSVLANPGLVVVYNNDPVTLSTTSLDLVVEFETKTAEKSFNVTVKKDSIAKITVSGTNDTQFDVFEGDQLTSDIVSSWTVNATWESGKEITHPAFGGEDGYTLTTTTSAGEPITLPYTWKVEDKELTFNYGGKTFSKTMTITPLLNEIRKKYSGELNETFTAADQGWTNFQDISSYAGDVFSITFDNNTASNNCKYYSSDTTARLYANSKLVINSSKTLTKIVFDSNISSTIKSDVGTLSSKTWTGEASTITFSVSDTTKIKSITVYYNGTTQIVISNDVNYKLAQRTVVEYANDFNTRLSAICVGYGSTNTTELEAEWNSLANQFNEWFVASGTKGLTDADVTRAKQLFANAKYVERDSASNDALQAMLGKYDEILSNYNFTDFLNGSAARSAVMQSTRAELLDVFNDNSPITIIVIISLIGVVSLSMYFFYDKRRRA